MKSVIAFLLHLIFVPCLISQGRDTLVKGIDVGVHFNNGFGVNVGFTLFKVEGGGGPFPAASVKKFTTGIEYNFDKNIDHYLQYSGEFIYLHYGLRLNQFIQVGSGYGIKVMPFAGLSFFGRCSVFVGYNYSTDSFRDRTYTFGANYCFAFNRFYQDF
ncbi:MAG: hypothetical protein ACI9N1_000734 [Flavobacteriales bacterium]|jgi:hypothetical protein